MSPSLLSVSVPSPLSSFRRSGLLRATVVWWAGPLLGSETGSVTTQERGDPTLVTQIPGPVPSPGFLGGKDGGPVAGDRSQHVEEKTFLYPPRGRVVPTLLVYSVGSGTVSCVRDAVSHHNSVEVKGVSLSSSRSSTATTLNLGLEVTRHVSHPSSDRPLGSSPGHGRSPPSMVRSGGTRLSVSGLRLQGKARGCRWPPQTEDGRRNPLRSPWNVKQDGDGLSRPTADSGTKGVRRGRSPRPRPCQQPVASRPFPPPSPRARPPLDGTPLH